MDCHIGKYLGVIRSKIGVFFRISNISVPCPHAQLRGRTIIKKLWTFFGPWGRDRSQSPPCWIFRVKQIHQSTVSERTTRQCYGYAAIFNIFTLYSSESDVCRRQISASDLSRSPRCKSYNNRIIPKTNIQTSHLSVMCTYT